ncbi:importin-5-like protein [Tanacetum coccineum]
MASSSEQQQQHLLSQATTILLDPNTTQFTTLISFLTSTNNSQRSQAESLFNFSKLHLPEPLVLKLPHLLHSFPLLEHRAFSAVLLRRILTNSADEDTSQQRQSQVLYFFLSESAKTILKQTLLECVGKEEVKTVCKKICDTVSDLAVLVVGENGWVELLPFMFGCVVSDDNRLKESALLIFAQFAHFIGEILLLHMDTLHNVFLSCLGVGIGVEVRIAALGAAINLHL